MVWGKKSGGGGGGVAWLALLVALAALFLSWKAYERSGGRLEDDLAFVSPESDPVGDVGTVEDTDWRDDLARARERLLERRDEVESEEDLAGVQRDVARIRESLERSFKGGGAEAREGWRELDADLERLQGQLKERSSRALETLDRTVEKMKPE